MSNFALSPNLILIHMASGADFVASEVEKRLLVTAVVIGAILLLLLLVVAITLCVQRKIKCRRSKRQKFVIPKDTPAMTTHRVHIKIPPLTTNGVNK